jgi:hypothetical protein
MQLPIPALVRAQASLFIAIKRGNHAAAVGCHLASAHCLLQLVHSNKQAATILNLNCLPPSMLCRLSSATPMLCLLPQGSPAGLPAVHHASLNSQPSLQPLDHALHAWQDTFLPAAASTLCQEVWAAPHTQLLPLQHSNLPMFMHAVLLLIFCHSSSFWNKAAPGCCSKSATLESSRLGYVQAHSATGPSNSIMHGQLRLQQSNQQG